jgi:hypothetical protein
LKTAKEYDMVKINLDNQVIESMLKNELDNAKVDYYIRTFHDTALDGVYEFENGYGYIEVNENDEKLVKEIIDNLKEDNCDIEQVKEKGKIDLSMIITIGVFAIMGLVIFFLAYNNWSINRKYSLMTSSNRYHHSWESNGTEYYSYKNNNTLDHVGYDKNRNGYFEKIKYYYDDGRIKSISSSINDNGVYNHYLHYTDDGKIYEESFYDQDGNLVKSVNTYNNGETITWSKTENDRAVDILEINNNGK